MHNANKLHKTSWQLNDGGKCRENFDITPALAWLEHIEKGGRGGREKGKVKKRGPHFSFPIFTPALALCIFMTPSRRASSGSARGACVRGGAGSRGRGSRRCSMFSLKPTLREY